MCRSKKILKAYIHTCKPLNFKNNSVFLFTIQEHLRKVQCKFRNKTNNFIFKKVVYQVFKTKLKIRQRKKKLPYMSPGKNNKRQ